MGLTVAKGRRIGIYVSYTELADIREGRPRMKWERLLALGRKVGIDAIVVPLVGDAPRIPPPSGA